MSLTKLCYVGQSVADELYDQVDRNIDRYLDGGFEDLMTEGNWAIPSNTPFELEHLKLLDPGKGPEVEVRNSLRVWASLSRLTPSMASENRIWVRLSHVEAISFCRDRWLAQSNIAKLPDLIRTHFFANSRTRVRDDHALSRLWWNAWLSAQAGGGGDMERTLQTLLSSADVRSGLIERPWIFCRRPLAARIIALLQRNQATPFKEKAFRDFMKAVNQLGAGFVFEAMTAKEIDTFLAECIEFAEGSSEFARA